MMNKRLGNFYREIETIKLNFLKIFILKNKTPGITPTPQKNPTNNRNNNSNNNSNKTGLAVAGRIMPLPLPERSLSLNI